MRKIIFLCFALFAFSIAVFAQPRPIEKKPEQKTDRNTVAKTPAPNSFSAKYEGGMYGYSKKETGILKFDDANERLVFFGKDQKEMFTIPYKSMLVIFPNSKSVSSTAGSVASHIPLPGAGLLGLITEKRRYLVVNYDDPDVDAKGLVNFKLENKELLDSVLRTLGEKAKLTPRGDAFYRPKTVAKDKDSK
jgi:hypothetical protein